MSSDVHRLAQQIVHFEARLADDPGSRVFLPLADLYRRVGRLADARRILEEGLQKHPRFVTARTALGLVLTEQSESAAARDILEQVLAVDGDNVLALRLLCRGAAESGSWERACELGERLLRLEPEDAGVREALREARRRLDTVAVVPEPEVAEDADAATTHQAAAKKDATITEGFETPTLADLYLSQGHPDKARVILERILALDPQRTDALEVMARLEAGPPAPPTAPKPTVSMPEITQGTGRGDELERFRAWLDATTDDRDHAN